MSVTDTINDLLDNERIHLPQMQSVIAGVLTLVVSFLWLTGGDVPDGLLNVYLIVIGFFFGDRMATQRARNAAAVLPEPISG